MNALIRWSWVFALLGVLCGLSAFAVRFVLGELGTVGTLMAVAGGAFLIAWAALDRDTLERGVHSRAFRYGGGSVAATLLAGALAVGVYLLADRHDARWDWTRDGRFSVSEKTLQVARSLDRDVRILAFFREGSAEERRFETLVEAYENATDRIEVRFVDPIRAPRLAEEHAVTSDYGTVILESGNDRQRLEGELSEEAVTNALIRLVSGEDHRICWATGHLEADPDDELTPGGLGIAVLKLEDQNYRFTLSDTLTEGLDPECEAVVIAAPQREWQEGEREALAAYVASGGRVLAMLEPESVPELSADFARYGVVYGDDLVIDPARRARTVDIDDPAFLIAMPDHFAHHPIVQTLRAPVLMGASRSVSAQAGAPGLALHELITAGPSSWGETRLDVDPYENPNAWMPEPGTELVGNVPIAVAVTVTDPTALGVSADGAWSPGGRIVAFGTADFARNILVGRAANQDLFSNAIAWLVEEDDQLAPGPQDEGDVLELSLVRAGLLYLIGLFLVPGLAVAAAVLTAVRRRYL